MGALERWALHDLRKHGLSTHLLRTDDEAARGVHRCANDLVRCPLADRQRLTGQHRLIDRATSFDDHAVHRHFLARPNPQEITDVDAVEWNVFFTAIGQDPPCGLRRQTQ
jgi:hypothetical protein